MSNSNIKIGEKAIEVLKGISIINQETVLRNDYLYTKYEFDVEDSKAKGEAGIYVNYDLPEGEVVVDENIGLGNINEFLSIMSSFDKDKLTLKPSGTTIKMKDNRKQVTFYTNTVDSLPQRETAGEELYNEGVTTLKFVLTEDDIEQINKDLKILNIDKLSLKGEDDKLSIIASNSITSNDTNIELDSKMVTKADGEFVFPNSKIFDVMLPGIYVVEVRVCMHENDELIIARLSSKTYEGLVYTTISES